MIRLILLIAFLATAALLIRQVRETPPEERHSLYLKIGLSTAALLLIILAVTGRIHWIGGLLGALLPIARSLLPLALGALPKILQRRQQPPPNQQQRQQSHHHSHGPLSSDEALAILGLQRPFTREEVIKAHRKLMQKVHPDRGGNDYLAAQLNAAKEVLLREL